MDSVLRLRRAPLGYRLESTFLKDKLPLVEQAIFLACKLEDAETCAELIEGVKARSLTAMLTVPRTGDGHAGLELERQVDELSIRVDSLEYTAYRSGWTPQIDEARSLLLAERSRLIERLRISEPRWRSISETPSFQRDAIVGSLKQRSQAAISMFFRAGTVVSVLLKDGRMKVGSKSIDSTTQQAISEYEKNLGMEKPRRESFDPANLSGLDAECIIPEALLEEALESGSLIVVPHGQLHLLPWAAMIFRSKRLFEYCAVGVTPNLSCLPALSEGFSFSAAPSVALLGNPDYEGLERLLPLHLAESEIHTIQDIFAAAGGVLGEPLVKDQATQKSFHELVRDNRTNGAILHIVSHGSFVADEPLNSGLLLTDGRLDASEIARCQLKYDEVVLSACSTGFRATNVQGIELSGDDVVGLPGAFLEAGVRSVLVSIPRAREDASLRFMTIYHEHRSQGLTPLVALRQAQCTMLSSEFSPHLWAGFTVYGCQ
jgi:CHAT domain-containing protein